VATPLVTTSASTLWRVATTTNEFGVTAEGAGLEAPRQPPYNVRPTRSEQKLLEITIAKSPLASLVIGSPGLVDPTAVAGAAAPAILSDRVTTYDAYDDFNNLTEGTTSWSSGDTRSYRGTYINRAGDAADPTLFILGMQTRS